MDLATVTCVVFLLVKSVNILHKASYINLFLTILLQFTSDCGTAYCLTLWDTAISDMHIAAHPLASCLDETGAASKLLLCRAVVWPLVSHYLWMQAFTKNLHVTKLFESTRHHGWLDAGGASFIRTLSKAWGEEPPLDVFNLVKFLGILVVLSRASATEGTAATESCELAIAHLFPVTLEYDASLSVWLAAALGPSHFLC